MFDILSFSNKYIEDLTREEVDYIFNNYYINPICYWYNDLRLSRQSINIVDEYNALDVINNILDLLRKDFTQWPETFDLYQSFNSFLINWGKNKGVDTSARLSHDKPIVRFKSQWEISSVLDKYVYKTITIQELFGLAEVGYKNEVLDYLIQMDWKNCSREGYILILSKMLNRTDEIDFIDLERSFLLDQDHKSNIKTPHFYLNLYSISGDTSYKEKMYYHLSKCLLRIKNADEIVYFDEQGKLSPIFHHFLRDLFVLFHIIEKGRFFPA